MNIVFINGSPKGSKSCSKYLLDTVKESILGEINDYDIDIADNKIKLTLGGVEGITLAEQSLDMATDEDIDAIIAGLDAPAGE